LITYLVRQVPTTSHRSQYDSPSVSSHRRLREIPYSSGYLQRGCTGRTPSQLRVDGTLHGHTKHHGSRSELGTSVATHERLGQSVQCHAACLWLAVAAKFDPSLTSSLTELPHVAAASTTRFARRYTPGLGAVWLAQSRISAAEPEHGRLHVERRGRGSYASPAPHDACRNASAVREGARSCCQPSNPGALGPARTLCVGSLNDVHSLERHLRRASRRWRLSAHGLPGRLDTPHVGSPPPQLLECLTQRTTTQQLFAPVLRVVPVSSE
jgi:hypothetical protein